MALKEVTVKADGRRALIRPEDFDAATHVEGYAPAEDTADGDPSPESDAPEPEAKPKKKSKKEQA
jgi:hypothetical protein